MKKGNILTFESIQTAICGLYQSIQSGNCKTVLLTSDMGENEHNQTK